MTAHNPSDTLVTVYGGSGFLGRVGQIHAVQANLRHAPSVEAADRHPDAIVTLGQSADDVAAEKARATIDGDEGLAGIMCGHAGLNGVNGGEPG